ARRTVGLDAYAERADGARDERFVAGRVARDLRRGAIQLFHLRLESVLRQLESIRAKAVRLDDVRTRVHVLLVNLPHHVWRAKIQLVIALIDEHALAVEHRAHRAVKDDDRLRVEKTLELRAHAALASGPEGAELAAPSTRTA